MLFRLVMASTLLLIAAYVEAVSEYLLPFNPLYALIAAVYSLTVLHAVALRTVRRWAPLVYAQVLGDLFVITGLVWVAGGVRMGFILLYPISVLSGAVLLYRRGGLILAGVATFLYAGLLWAVRVELINPQGLFDVPFLTVKALLYSVFVTGVACVTVALTGAYLSESLRSVGAQLLEAEEQVADLRELNDVIVNSMQSGLLTTNADGRVLYLNPFGEQILGCHISKLRGIPLAEALGSEVLGPEAMAPSGSVAGPLRAEILFRRLDGRTIDLGIAVSPLATARGGHLLVFQDLTEIKRRDREGRIKEKLAVVGEMAAQLAHEIRNPLGSISGSAQFLMSEADVPPDQARLLAIITKESKRLSATLDRFLFQARPTSEAPRPVDLGPVVAEAVTLLRNGSELGQGHVVDFRSDGGAFPCLADRDQITQVFWNLARNALEAMPEGGRLGIELRRSADLIVLEVSDEGPGMDNDVQRRAPEPFHTSRRASGTGLGLAIVYRIVREHRGDIVIYAQAGKGTRIEVRLPLLGGSDAAA
jgi:two-component system, NtrC family, sensor histidine kinase PilS